MATNMTFADYVTPIPADWLNNVNTTVNNANVQNLAQSLPIALPVGSTASTPLSGDNSTLVATTAYTTANFAKLGGNAGQQFLVAPATSANQAVNLSQFPAKPVYSGSQTGTITIANNTTYSVSTVSITMPNSSKSGFFRVLVQLVSQGLATTNNVENIFQNLLFDGTNTQGGAPWNVYKKNANTGWATADSFLWSNAAYAPGQVVTFTQKVATGSEDALFTLTGCNMTLFVWEA